jgi:hypothetical protein
MDVQAGRLLPKNIELVKLVIENSIACGGGLIFMGKLSRDQEEHHAATDFATASGDWIRLPALLAVSLRR